MKKQRRLFGMFYSWEIWGWGEIFFLLIGNRVSEVGGGVMDKYKFWKKEKKRNKDNVRRGITENQENEHPRTWSATAIFLILVAGSRSEDFLIIFEQWSCFITLTRLPHSYRKGTNRLIVLGKNFHKTAPFSRRAYEASCVFLKNCAFTSRWVTRPSDCSNSR